MCARSWIIVTMMRAAHILIAFCALICRSSFAQVSTTADPSCSVNCTGAYGDITTRDELLNELLGRVLAPVDSPDTAHIKGVFLNYLTRTPVFLDMINCTNGVKDDEIPSARLLQEDEDDDDGGGGAGVGGASGVIGALTGTNANPLDNTNVLNGVRRILANVFTGNLIGVIQESVGLRSPEPVTTVFTDVLSTLFGSNATAGITGIVANISTTPRPLSSTLLPPGYEAYIQQHYLQQQYLAQQQLLAQGGGQAGGLGGIGSGQLGGQAGLGGIGSSQGLQGGGVPGQGSIPTGSVPQRIPSQHQYLQQQYGQGNRRRPGTLNQNLQAPILQGSVGLPQQGSVPQQQNALLLQQAQLQQQQQLVNRPQRPPQKQAPQEDYYEDNDD